MYKLGMFEVRWHQIHHNLVMPKQMRLLTKYMVKTLKYKIVYRVDESDNYPMVPSNFPDT